MFSKTDHVRIIEEIARGMALAGIANRYLELGIAKCKCFNKIAKYFKVVESVDINNCIGYIDDVIFEEKHCYNYVSTTDEYFARFYVDDFVFNLVFIDASHKFENVKKDFENSLKCLAKNGIIIIHDTHSPSKEWDQHCEDAHKIEPYIKKKYPELSVFTIPLFFGLTLVRY